jgi:chitosanase
MITAEQKAAAKSIVSIFETGKAAGDYGAATILPDGAGISYGAHQATDRADSLDAILMAYLDRGGQRAADVREVLALVQADATTGFRSVAAASPAAQRAVSILRALGTDPVMQAAQEAVFERDYWQPAERQCIEMGLVLPLSWALVYDTCIHSGPGGVARIRALFSALPPARGGDERTWAAAYVAARRAWLASRGGIVAQTVYRMDSFHALIGAGNWGLVTPFTVRGVRVGG